MKKTQYKARDIKNSTLGFIVGDALGTPVEFTQRDILEKNPVVGFRDGGRPDIPLGAWSDDTSTILCLMETIVQKGLDFDLYSQKLCEWMYNNYYTPFGKTFGVGRATSLSIYKLKKGISYLDSGEKGERSNGNGSLMRILPLVFCLYDVEDKYEIIKTCSAITHAHDISVIACQIFVEYFHCLAETCDKVKAYKEMQRKIKKKVKSDYICAFDRILNQNIYEIDDKFLSGEGYVVNTLEIALFSFINGNDYKDCVLKAINFGNDTDTNGALTGALAGYYYGNIPEEWIKKIIKVNEIIEIINLFTNKECMNE